MPRSARLRLGDLRTLADVVAECRDLGDDPAAWWAHFTRRVCGLVGADFGGCGEIADLRPDGGSTTLGIGEWGWENGFDREPWEWSVTQFDIDPGYSELYRRYFLRLAADAGVCLARTDLMADREWTRSVSYQRVSEPMGVDHYVWCVRGHPRTAGRSGMMVVTRAAGGRDFTARDKALVREAHAWVAPLVGGPLARFGEPSPADLPPRVRRVLKCLLEGDTDKQAAARLGLTRHTVNGYAKLIYSHFAVESRAELLARWVKRGWGGRFAWADD